jgi:hypothetical protein
MARDPLQVLLAVRQRAVDQQRQALAERLRVEAEAVDRVRALTEAILRDQNAPSSPTDALLARDVLIATRRHRLAERQIAAVAVIEAARLAEAARGVLADTRLAAEAVQTLIAERSLASRVEADRRAQHELDDITRTRRR